MLTQFKKNNEKNQRALARGFTPTPMQFGVSSRSERGFTLVEILVVVAIVLVLTVVSVSGYLPFITKIDYENVVLDVALNIRQYQFYGVGTKQNTGVSTFENGYGVHAEPGQNSIIFFEDKDNDKKYPDLTCSAGSECLKKISMDGYKVAVIEADSGPVTSSMDITFKRPYLDATFFDNGSVSTTGTMKICIQDTAGAVTNYMKIVISRTGQIFVAPTNSVCST